jgi:hypothetical protein
MRSVWMFLVLAVVAVAVAVPALAAGGGSSMSAPGNAQPPQCQTTAATQLRLSDAQGRGLRTACNEFKTAVAAADRVFTAKVAKLAAGDRAGLWQAREQRRTAVWAARDKIRTTVHATLGNAGARSGLARGQGAAAQGGGHWGPGSGGRGVGRPGQRGGMGGQGQCPYAQS